MDRPHHSTLILIPAFEEEQRLPGVLSAVSRVGVECSVLVVDDASTDRTSRVALEGGAKVLRHELNLGYGGALQTGYKYALGHGVELLVQMDADGQHDPAWIPRLLQPIQQGEADLVLGSRFLEPSGYDMGSVRTLGRRMIRGLGKLAGLETTDPTSGLQAMNRKVLELYARDFFPQDYPDVDVLIVARRHGLRIAEIPVEMAASPRPSTMHGGLRSFWYAYKMLLSIFAAGGEH